MRKRIAFVYSFRDEDWLGGKNYFVSLFEGIQAANTNEFEFVFIIGEKNNSAVPKSFRWLRVVKTSLMDRYHPLWFLRQLTMRIFGTDPLLHRFLEFHNIDLLSHFDPLCRRSEIKTLPWLYDFQFMHLPEYWQKKHIKWAKKRYNIACRNGNGLIVSSNDAAMDLKIFAPWCTLPIFVLQFVSNSIDFLALPTKDNLTKKYNLPSQYFYLPNQFWKNKNHKLVIDALNILKLQGIKITVICTGKTYDGRLPKYFDELIEYRDDLNLADEFRVLGIVPYSDLQALMLYSCAILNPSRFEGWSTTVEEAKTLKRPLLLSDIKIHREQAPDYAKFFDVNNPKELADLLRESFKSDFLEYSQEMICGEYMSRLKCFGNRYLDILRMST